MKPSIVVLLLVFLMPSSLLAQKTATLIYIDQYKDIAIKEMKRTGIPASITLAQGIIESNSGQSNLASNFKNHFGIKCKSDWQGETTYQDDDTKQECFRVYPTAVRSFIDHSDFLKSRPNYASLFELDPVDDSAWAYGLKKAGYATATDYPRKLLKVINEFELSQYNFPELAKEDSMETTNKVDTVIEASISLKKDTLPPAITSAPVPALDNLLDRHWNKPLVDTKKDTLIIAKIDSAASPVDSIALSSVKGLSVTGVVNSSIPNTIQSLALLAPETKKDTTSTLDTLIKVVVKPTINYPTVRFRINNVPVVWAKAGSSYLAIANSQMVPLYRLFEYNEIQEASLLATDQLVFLAPKKKEIPKKVHTIKMNETLYGISQSEGIQLNYLKQYNPKATDDNLKEGDFLFLFTPYDAPKKSNPFLEAIKPLSNKTATPSANTISSPSAKEAPTSKDSVPIEINKAASKNKINFIKKLNHFNKKKS
jgi:LysM repeat protein